MHTAHWAGWAQRPEIRCDRLAPPARLFVSHCHCVFQPSNRCNERRPNDTRGAAGTVPDLYGPAPPLKIVVQMRAVHCAIGNDDVGTG